MIFFDNYVFHHIREGNVKTTWSIEGIYDDSSRYDLPCNINVVVDKLIKETDEANSQTIDNFGLGCSEVLDYIY